MCFAPYISLTTFIIEFMLALIFFFQRPKDKLNRFIATLSFTLGFYQLNEFLICTTGLKVFTRLAFATTAILPAMAITYAIIMWRKKIRYYWHLFIYSPAIFFIVLWSTPLTFKAGATCSTVFIQYPSQGLFSKFFGLYYLAYLVGAVALFYFASVNTKKVPVKRLMYFGMLGLFIFTIPTYIFLMFLPSLEIQFSSVLCEFALLLAIEFIFVIWYKEKHKIKF